MRLILTFHAHQPLGQLPWVTASAVRDCYEPLLKVLLRHPSIKTTLHFSGTLLDILLAESPAIPEQIKVLLERDHIELMGGTRFESILPIWPRADQRAQLQQSREQLKVLFGCDVVGAWLPERVWEPQLSDVLAKAGYRWTMIDDNGVPGQVIAKTDDVTIFPLDVRLRELIPWRSPDEVISYLRNIHQNNPDAVAVFADDAEKFGSWPGTHELIFDRGYLDSLLTAFEENADWLQTAFPTECVPDQAPQIEIAPTTYPEMLEWSGGNWRNFLARYPESRNMYEAVLRAPQSEARLVAQCNDAYWYGVFGGLYLPHLRQAIYGKVAEAESQRSDKTAREITATGDVIARNGNYILGINPRGGCVFQWIDLAARHNWFATLRRYDPADWYARGGGVEHFLSEDATPQSIAAGTFAEIGDFASEDWEITAQNAWEIALSRQGGVWQDGEFLPLQAQKYFWLLDEGWKVRYQWTNTGNRALRLWWGSEWNIALSGSDFPTRQFEAAGNSWDLREVREAHNVTQWQLRDQWLERTLFWELSDVSDVWLMPFYVKSADVGAAAEDVFEQTVLLIHRKLRLEPGETYTINLSLRVEQV